MKEYEELKGVAEAMHEQDDKAQMRIDCSYLLSMIDRLESLEQEMQEQARIIGMGAGRELALVAKVEFLEKRASQALIHLAQCLDQVYSGEVDHDLEHLADHARADASILSGVDLDMQANKGE